jgi:site-specific DNA recombinase
VFTEVDEALWNQCNALLDEQLKKRNRPARKAVHLFAGVTYCHCGTKMYVPSNTPKYICYECRNKIPVVDLEAVYQEQLRGFFWNPQEIAAYLNQTDAVINEKKARIQVLEQEQASLKKDLEKLYDLYFGDHVTKEGFTVKYTPLSERMKQLDDQIPTLQGELDFLTIQHLSQEEVISEATDLYTRWPKLEHEEKRRIVENITQRITIGKSEVEIDLCYLPNSAEIMAGKQRDFSGSSSYPGGRYTHSGRWCGSPKRLPLSTSLSNTISSNRPRKSIDHGNIEPPNSSKDRSYEGSLQVTLGDFHKPVTSRPKMSSGCPSG